MHTSLKRGFAVYALLLSSLHENCTKTAKNTTPETLFLQLFFAYRPI